VVAPEADTAVAVHRMDVADTVAATAALHEEAATVVDTAAEEADRHTAHTRCDTRLARTIYHETLVAFPITIGASGRAGEGHTKLDGNRGGICKTEACTIKVIVGNM
jgi:hypothetical protein